MNTTIAAKSQSAKRSHKDMQANKRIPVTESVWVDLCSLKRGLFTRQVSPSPCLCLHQDGQQQLAAYSLHDLLPRTAVSQESWSGREPRGDARGRRKGGPITKGAGLLGREMTRSFSVGGGGC